MNNKITIIAVVIAVMVSGAVAVATVPSSTAANAGDANEISTCTTIDEPGTYQLTNDIAADGDGDECLSVNAHGVTIDGNGYSITNASGPEDAIFSWTDDVVVKNLTVSGFSTAISLENGADITVDEVTLRDNGVGIVGTQVSPTLNNSVLEGNDVAISVGESKVESANTVYRNNGEGVTAGYIVSVNDTFVGNGDFAIEAPGGSVSGATIKGGDGDGIAFVENYVSPDDENEFTVVDSVVRENDGHGIYVPEDANSGGQNLTVENSVIADNSGLGIKVGAGNPTADATDNYWGASDGPSSATDDNAPFEDPVTGKLAFGIGDEVSENPDEQGVSNVRFDPFLTENPNADDGTDDKDDSSPREISECTVIDESGTHEIVSDITNESANPCIDVQASDVVIDGNGHTIDGVDTNGTGISVETADNVTVRDVTVTGFDTGVTSADTAGVTLVDTALERNGLGVTVGDNSALRLKTSIVTNNSRSGVVVDSGSATISNSQLTNNGESGLVGFLTADVTMRTSLVAGNTVGIEMGEASLVSENNTVRDNEQLGVKVAGTLESTDDNVYRNGAGIRGGTDTTLTGTWVTDNERFGVKLLAFEPDPTVADITGSRIAENGGDGVRVGLNGDHEEFDVEIHDSAIVDNDGLGVNSTATKIVNATGNDWGSDDGPSSADDPDAPFADPVTGRLADGSGDEVSEHPEKPGVSNVHFTTEAPEDDSDHSDGDQSDGDQNDGDQKERSSDDAAYQFDVAVGEVIEDLGEDADSFYGTQGRLVRAQTVAANGTVTGHFMAPSEDYADATDGCEVYGSTVDYDGENGTVTATLSHTGDVDCGNVTMTFAAYELPGDDVTFVRERADGQELVASRTVTLEPGEEVEITLSLDE